MHVPNRPSELKGISRKLDSSLIRLQTELELDDRQWREVLGLSALDFRKYSERRMELPFSALHRVSETYHLSVDAIVQNDIDYPTLIAHLNGNLDTVPDEYLVHGTTRRRTLKLILECAERSFGWQIRSFVLKRFQLTEAALARPDDYVNAALMTKVSELLTVSGMPYEHFHWIGGQAVKTLKGSVLERELAAIEHTEQLYVRFVEDLVHHLGNSCRYKVVRTSPEHVTIDAWDSAEILERFRLKRFSREFCGVKLGLFRSLPAFAKLPYAEVEESRCLHRGDTSCRFEIKIRPPLTLTGKT